MTIGVQAKKIDENLNKKVFQLFIKRVFDFILSITLLIILSPVLLAIIIWIKVDSSGPAVFKQIRIGINGKPYTIYKFRTMYNNADKKFIRSIEKDTLNSFVFQDKDDPRITKCGKYLRKTSLDELPQLFNIINGDMSLIGPRPEIPAIADLYDDYQKLRLLMKPGVSGLAQVNGRGDLELQKTIEYDIKYISNFSLLLDFKILLKTFKVVFSHEGAY